jgi:glycolate oxidase iron-sulfur subunit
MLGEGDPGIDLVLGGEMPDGVRFVGPTPDLGPRWRSRSDAPADDDLAACVACGLCLPHCPTYRVTGEESASPRGRITAMRSVAEGLSEPDETFARFMDLCLACRACEDVCPSHVPFGRMVERARVQVEPLRSPPLPVPCGGSVWMSRCPGRSCCGSPRRYSRSRASRSPKRVRTLTPERSELFRRLPARDGAGR